MYRPTPSGTSRFRAALIAHVFLAFGFPALASAQLWEDATESTIGLTAQWSNKVELADLDGAGRPDILIANGGNYNEAGSPERNRVFLNQGPGQPFAEVTRAVVGEIGDLARVVRARDLNGDGHTDILVGTTYETQSRLYSGDGSGGFTEVTATNLPSDRASIGDLEVGDVDGDGDMDVVLADWGPVQMATRSSSSILIPTAILIS